MPTSRSDWEEAIDPRDNERGRSRGDAYLCGDVIMAQTHAHTMLIHNKRKKRRSNGAPCMAILSWLID